MNKKIIFLMILVCVIIVIGYIQITKPNLRLDVKEFISVENFSGNSDSHALSLEEKSASYSSAVEIIPGGEFINSEPFTLKSLIGKKVILVDFWTYTCINCKRTTPYLNEWYKKYKDQGLEIVGVHTPEFEFEKEYSNVKKAVEDEGIMYPVVQDNNYATWMAYGNRYWPRKYLIDIDGFIIYDKIGEGGYSEFEKAIQNALVERVEVLQLSDVINKNIVTPDVAKVESENVQSPEAYFGSLRNEYLGNGNKGIAGQQTLLFPDAVLKNTLYLEGTWNIQDEFAENKSSNAKIRFIYNAKNVYLVASAKNEVRVRVFQDQVLVKTLMIKDHNIYMIIQGFDYGQHALDLEIDGTGFEAFAFTFG